MNGVSHYVDQQLMTLNIPVKLSALDSDCTTKNLDPLLEFV